METQNTTGTIATDLEKEKQKQRYESYLRECKLCDVEMLINKFKNQGESFKADCLNRFNELHILYTNIIVTFSKSEEERSVIESKLKEFTDIASSILEKFNNAEKNIIAEELKLPRAYRYDLNYYEKVYKNAVSASLKLQELRVSICGYVWTLGGYVHPDGSVNINKSKCIAN